MPVYDEHARLWERVQELENGIRKVMQQRGDDRCHQDLTELFQLLPEGDTRPRQDTLITLENCQRYIAAYHDPNITYISPQRRIEELERELELFKEKVKMLANDIANLERENARLDEIVGTD